MAVVVVAEYPGAYKLEVDGRDICLTLETDTLKIFQAHQLASDLNTAGQLAGQSGVEPKPKS